MYVGEINFILCVLPCFARVCSLKLKLKFLNNLIEITLGWTNLSESCFIQFVLQKLRVFSLCLHAYMVKYFVAEKVS